MQSQDTVRIPLRARDGSIRAYTIVDAADAEWVNLWRWHLMVNGYVARNDRSDGRKGIVYLHRALLDLGQGNPLWGDHISRDRLDNRRANLRAIPRPANAQNVPSQRGASKHRGVYLERSSGTWYAQIHVNGRSIALGRFPYEEDAAEAAREARERLMPHAVD